MKDPALDCYTFWADDEGRELEFFSTVVSEMSRTFEISEAEAVARINQRFAGLEFFGDDIIFHRSEDYWAKDVMFGHGIWSKSGSSADPLPAPGWFERWLHTQMWWIIYWRCRRQRQIARAIRKVRGA